ncbi:MAG: hypothetical protein AAGD43_23835 [Pseudomonadota bacterium]
MSMFRKSLIASGIFAVPVAIGMAISAPVVAQQTTGGRYTMHQTDDGMLRLDTQTGAVSLCSRTDDAWACKPMADKKSANDEIARLQKENKELRSEVNRLDKMLGMGSPKSNSEADPPRPGGSPNSFRLPTEKEVDQALNYFERMLRKFQDRLKKLEQGQSNEPKQL